MITENPGLIWTILSFLIVIGPLIFIHELGHYFVGRWFGVKAEVFSIGFGREIGGWTDRRGTRWKIGWLPLGGYVKFSGDMGPASQPSDAWLTMPAEERARTFQAKELWQRFLIVAAGPVTNFLFAIIVFSAFLLIYGQQRTPPVIAVVAPASAAAKADLRPGDRIASIAGRDVETFEDVARLVSLRPLERLPIEVERAGNRIQIFATPTAMVERDRFGNEFRKGLLGISPTHSVIEPVPVGAVLSISLRQTADIVTMTLEGIGQIVTGRRSVKELGGPLKIAQYSGQQASLGVSALLWFMAVISINLGFINLLPIPLLDGGHLFFYLIEGVRRKPLAPEAQEWAFRTGVAALLALMVFVTLNDLASFGLWSKLGGLIG